MITLNSEKGLVRIESWDDILSRPGFTPNLNPSALKLREIIGRYIFKEFKPCGLSTCHQPHGRGYLVVTTEGFETNIGKDCGKTHFDADFEQMRRAYDQDLLNQERRERLLILKNRLPSIADEINTLKSQEHGANWLHLQGLHLTGQKGELPLPIVDVMRRMIRTGSGTLTRQRETTERERELARAANERPLGDRRPPAPVPRFVDEPIGMLAGFGALLEENSIRNILVKALEVPMATLASTDIESASNRALADLVRITQSIDADLGRARAALSLGQSLFTRENLEQLSVYVGTPAHKRGLNAYLDTLPIVK